MYLQHKGAGLMRIKNSLQFVLGVVFAAFIFSGTAKAVTMIDVDVPFASGTNYSFSQSFNVNPAATPENSDVALGLFELKFTFDMPGGDALALTQMLVFLEGTIANLKYEWSDGAGSLDYIAGVTHLLTDGLMLVITGNATENSTLAVSMSAVPVPPAAILFGSALLGIGFLSRRRRRKKQNNSMATAA